MAQTVVKMVLEPMVEPIFHPDSYGYRPGRSALDAVGVARKRCWGFDWVIDLDIKAFFDSIPHDLVETAVAHHTDLAWVRLYIGRWLRAPFERPDGTLQERTKGTPQGGVASRCLANLFLHYAFDVWMPRTFPNNPFERYADDVIVHCRSQEEAEPVLEAIRERFAECGLELHPTKTKIVYCKDDDRPGQHEHIKFDFLGYTFRPRRAKNRWGKFFVSFLPAISTKAAKAIRKTIRDWRMASTRNNQRLEDLGALHQPGGAGLAELLRAVLPLEVRSGAPPLQRGPRTHGRDGSTSGSNAENERQCTGWGASRDGTPSCLSCGNTGYDRRLEGKSRMTRERPVRFCEGGGVRFLSATRLILCFEHRPAARSWTC